MVIMAQDFSMRYPLVDGHGNFGSIDGDGAAAMRYTEAKLSRLGEAMMNDIRKNTVDFKPNYDGEEQEPVELPSLFPNLLCNGTSGIAVGLATDFLPHNLCDLYSAMYYLIDCARDGIESDMNTIIDLVKAPDFPGGGEIIGLDGVRKAYKEGKGKCVLRGKYEIETNKKQTSIIITELPFKTNKTKMVNKVANELKDAKNSKGIIIKKGSFTQVKEIRDESNKDGIRIVIELKSGENPDIVINNLIKQDTGFQKSLKMNFTALESGQPKVFSLKEALEQFMSHSANVVIRRTQFNLDKAQKRYEIVQGVLILFEGDNLDLVIDTIRQSENPVQSVMGLGYTEIQANFICETKLGRLSKLSQDQYTKEKDDLEASIEHYSLVLSDQDVLLEVIRADFKSLEEKFGDERRTSITLDYTTIEDEDLIEDEELIITYTTDGVIKAIEESAFNTQNRGGKGVKGASSKEDEAIKFMFTSHSKDDLLFFTNTGRCYTLKAYKIGKSTKAAKGKSINNYLNLEPGEKILNVLNTNIKNNPESYLLMITKKGVLKKLALKELSSRYAYTKVINFKEDDKLVDAQLIDDEDVMIVTMCGQSLRIATNLEGNKAIRSMGRQAAGVKGISLADHDEVISMFKVSNEDTILTVTERGLAKRTLGSEWNIIGRGGKGVVAHKLSEKTGVILCALVANSDEELFIATANGLIQRIKNDSIRECGRSTSGVKIMNLADGDRIVSVSACKATENEDKERDGAE